MFNITQNFVFVLTVLSVKEMVKSKKNIVLQIEEDHPDKVKNYCQR